MARISIFACFEDLGKAYDLVSRNQLWKVLPKYGVDDQLLHAIKSFYCRPKVCVWVNGKQSKPFCGGVGLWQGCNLSPLFTMISSAWWLRTSNKFSGRKLELIHRNTGTRETPKQV